MAPERGRQPASQHDAEQHAAGWRPISLWWPTGPDATGRTEPVWAFHTGSNDRATDIRCISARAAHHTNGIRERHNADKCPASERPAPRSAALLWRGRHATAGAAEEEQSRPPHRDYRWYRRGGGHRDR